jgi:hypothetical protein
MKKSLLLLPLLAITACSSYDTARMSATFAPVLETDTKAKIAVGDRITGSAQCTEALFITVASPSRHAHVHSMQSSHANNICVAGAVYDAMAGANADVIVSPRYTTQRTAFGCLPMLGCLWSDTKVLVEGFAGRVSFN